MDEGEDVSSGAGAPRPDDSPESAVSRPHPSPSPSDVPSAERILQAAAHVLAQQGATGLSMADVAREAGVSKGLIHYHYRDKDALLARLARWLADEIEGRERRALVGVPPGQAIDALWAWLDDELECGDIRALIELSRLREGDAPVAARVASQRRRAVSATTITTLFDCLGLRARVPAPMLAEVFVAFVDGLAVDATPAPMPGHRVAYDVFWLAMLSLAE